MVRKGKEPPAFLSGGNPRIAKADGDGPAPENHSRNARTRLTMRGERASARGARHSARTSTTLPREAEDDSHDAEQANDRSV